jgi:preprotein translocase subunit SecA
MLEKLVTALFGSQHERDLKALIPLVHAVNAKEHWAMGLKADEFPAQTATFRDRLAAGESLDDLLPEAFALAREAARRVLGERCYDVQILGAIVLHQGKIMEMKTGEGKTLSSVPAAYLNSLEGKGVHVVTVNDYLAERDADWMRPVYTYLGISVGAILSRMDNEARKVSYRCDITYGTNNEFGFDYLRDNMRWSAEGGTQPTHHYCIIDEIDSILIDESRTPLIISGAADDNTEKFREVNRIVGYLTECEKDPETDDYPEEDLKGDFKLDEKGRRVSFTDEGLTHAEELLQRNRIIDGSLYLDDNFEYVHYITQAVRAHKLYTKDVDYVVQEGKVEIVDEFTGRILHGRRYSEGLHQAIEAKEGIRVGQRNRTLATITFQNFFRMYEKISGMTGTADTEAKEFTRIYNLDVVVIPTNRPLARLDEDDVIYFNEGFKYDAICDEIAEVNAKGQPMLIGTVSIEKSEHLSKLLTHRGIRHEVLNAKNHSREALIIAEAGAKGSVTIATNMAGRGTDIKLGGNPEFRARRRVGTEAPVEEFERVFKEEYAKWQKDYQEVRELGGLYILGTERHESRRIDNQLRGRSGRQGDPGVSRFFLSLEDNLMRLFARDNVKSLMGRLGMADGEPIFHPWINRTIEKAQTRVEDRNFEIRKHLLDYDDVLNAQRTFIYEQREKILSDDNLIERIHSATEDLLDEIFDAVKERSSDRDQFLKALAEEIRINFFFEPEQDLAAFPEKELQSSVATLLHDELENKRSQVGTEAMNAFIRFEYLRAIDTRWQEHLENLEALREAVYLRSYAQKNPLVEYKREGFQIFDTLIANIRTSLAQKVHKVRIEKRDRSYRGRPVQGQAQHSDFGLFGGGGSAAGPAAASGPRKGSATATASRPKGAQVVRSVPKVGRNDPCPCGSGKKYKYCHGAS